MSTPRLERSLDRHMDRLPLRERKKMKTRRAIQDHALRLFTEQGYDATTIEQIAEAAEISPSTFFRYFPTKEDVVIADEYDSIMRERFRAQPPGLSPMEALRAAIREVLPAMHPGDYDVIAARMRLLESVPALRARTFENMRTGTMRVILDLIAERTGRSTDDTDLQAFAWAVIGVLLAAMYAWTDSGCTLDLPALADRNLEYLAAGCPL